MDKVLLVEDEDIIRRGLLYAVDWLKEDCVGLVRRWTA